MYTWLLECDMVSMNPVVSIHQEKSAPKERFTFTHEEHLRILDLAKNYVESQYEGRGKYMHALGDYWTYACTLAWETGLRLADIANLEKGHVLWDRNGLKLKPRKTRRIGKQVEIPLSEETMHMLRQMALAAGASQYISPTMYFMEHSSRTNRLTKQFVALARQAKVFNRSFHCYRHTFITRMLEGGISAEIISTMTGQTISQVMEYAHIKLETKHALIRRLNEPTNPQPNSGHLQPQSQSG